MKDFAEHFYKSKAWKDCRKSYIAKRVAIDTGLCERCHKLAGYILHHKITLTPLNINDPDITLNHCNLMYVCKPCHDLIHDDLIHGEHIHFDEQGRIIPPKR